MGRCCIICVSALAPKGMHTAQHKRTSAAMRAHGPVNYTRRCVTGLRVQCMIGKYNSAPSRECALRPCKPLAPSAPCITNMNGHGRERIPDKRVHRYAGVYKVPQRVLSYTRNLPCVSARHTHTNTHTHTSMLTCICTLDRCVSRTARGLDSWQGARKRSALFAGGEASGSTH